MKTIDDFLKTIEEDSELNNLVINSEELKKDYRPRTRSGRSKSRSTKEGIAVEYFWDNIDGTEFKIVLERKYGIELGDTRIVSEVKSALLLYISKGGVMEK